MPPAVDSPTLLSNASPTVSQPPATPAGVLQQPSNRAAAAVAAAASAAGVRPAVSKGGAMPPWLIMVAPGASQSAMGAWQLGAQTGASPSTSASLRMALVAPLMAGVRPAAVPVGTGPATPAAAGSGHSVQGASLLLPLQPLPRPQATAVFASAAACTGTSVQKPPAAAGDGVRHAAAS